MVREVLGEEGRRNETHGIPTVSCNLRFSLVLSTFASSFLHRGLRWSIWATRGSNQAGERGHFPWHTGKKEGTMKAGLSLCVKICWQRDQERMKFMAGLDNLWSQSVLLKRKF